MPYFTSNPAYGQGVSNLVRAFIGDPGDALIPYKQDLLAAQVENERRQADVISRQASLYDQKIADLSKQIQGRDALAALYGGFGDRVNSYQGPTMPGQTREQAFAPQAFDAMVPDLASAMVRAGYTNPDMASLASMMPGLSDEQRSRNYMATGKTIGKNDFFSPADRDANAVYDVAGGSRAVRGDGSTVVDIAPAFLDAQGALADQRRAMAQKALMPSTGKGAAAHKIPRMGKSETQLVLNALAQGAGYGEDDPQFFQDISSNPQLSTGLYSAMENAWAQSGGNTMAVIRAGQEFLNTVPQPEEYGITDGPLDYLFGSKRRLEGVQLPQTTPNAPPAEGAAPSPENIKVLGGKTFVKINGQWFEQ